ncbi:MAG: SDR family oxidoreductase [Acidimicrobiia bacterium]|jgi:NAD(P)-dependent dehydrogenase (short-subunit alcohol dehydrogenase family)
MELDLHGRRAVVTGASVGIGAETVRVLAEHGATVAFCARTAAAVEALAASLARSPGTVRGYEADMGDAAAVARFCDTVEADIGAPDILVNNVGASPSRNFLHMSDDDWFELFELNVMAAMRLTRRFLPAMRAQRWGRVVMMNTAAAKYPGAAIVDYAATKGALSVATKAIARKYAADGVLINSIAPGRIRTEMWERTAREVADRGNGDIEAVFTERSKDIPIGRFGRADEIANVVLFLCSDLASYMVGATIDVDGGLGSYVY